MRTFRLIRPKVMLSSFGIGTSAEAGPLHCRNGCSWQCAWLHPPNLLCCCSRAMQSREMQLLSIQTGATRAEPQSQAQHPASGCMLMLLKAETLCQLSRKAGALRHGTRRLMTLMRLRTSHLPGAALVPSRQLSASLQPKPASTELHKNSSCEAAAGSCLTQICSDLCRPLQHHKDADSSPMASCSRQH